MGTLRCGNTTTKEWPLGLNRFLDLYSEIFSKLGNGGSVLEELATNKDDIGLVRV